MMFIHQPFPYHDIVNDDTENGRFYTTPDGVFLSVTSTLGRYFGHEWLNEWKERVGEEQAMRISTQATRRGTSIHSIAESYLRNESDWAKGRMPVNLETFSGLRKMLDEHVTTIYGIEMPLYSPVLKTAGRADLLALWDHEISICDFKTSKRIKDEKDILSYFAQLTCYAMMVEKRYHVRIDWIVVLMSIDHEKPVYFRRETNKYRDLVEKIFIG